LSDALHARLFAGIDFGLGRFVFRLAAPTLALMAILCGLAACGPVPRPFKPDDKSELENPLLRLPDHGGVVVPPAGGLPRAQAVALAEAVAEALRSYDIPASARLGNSQSLVLDLQVRAQGRRILLAANLADPAGVSMLEDQNQGDVPGEPERPESWRAYAQPLARAVVLAMKPETVIARRLPAVLIGKILGAPGDGGDVLARNLGFHLARAGLRVADAASDDTIGVEGTVTIVEIGSEMRRVAVSWRVIDKNGAELGRVDMQNHVLRAVIERQWSEMSFEIANASADSILDIAERFRIRAN
jgi:hypothetical protein